MTATSVTNTYNIEASEDGGFILFLLDETGKQAVFESSSRQALERYVIRLIDNQKSEDNFLDVWKRGVRMHPQFFEIPNDGVDSAKSIWDIKPKVEKYWERHFYVLSSGERVFLAAMLSFFNNSRGQSLLDETNTSNICAIANALDGTRRNIIAELFLHYHGW